MTNYRVCYECGGVFLQNEMQILGEYNGPFGHRMIMGVCPLCGRHVEWIKEEEPSSYNEIVYLREDPEDENN